MKKKPTTKPTRREATPEQKAAAAERRAAIRSVFAKISALPLEKRVIIAARYGIRTAGEGHELSPSNQMLLVMQFPNVSVVGGFDQWRKAGRIVKKGEKALAIWVPLKGRDSAPDGPAASTLPALGDGSGEGQDSGPRFILGNVFDISQTVDAATGEALPALPYNRPPLELADAPRPLLALPAPGESTVAA